ncbi:MAG: hypothetical protein ACK55Q_15240, partial [Dolichospermum sp.]
MNLLVWSGNRELLTGNTGRKTELIPTESCMATPRKLSKIKYYSYNSRTYAKYLSNPHFSVTSV